MLPNSAVFSNLIPLSQDSQTNPLRPTARVTDALRVLLDEGRFDYGAVQQRVAPPAPTIPTLHLPAPDLRVYDTLLLGATA